MLKWRLLFDGTVTGNGEERLSARRVVTLGHEMVTEAGHAIVLLDSGRREHIAFGVEEART